MNDGPVFITGLADTGKTPLGRMLDVRSSITVTRHTQLWRRFADRFADLESTEDVERCLSALLRDPAVLRLRPDADQLRATFDGNQPTITQILTWLHAQHARRLGKRRWGEQDSSLETYADRLLRDLPTARVVHLVRDPVTAYRIIAARAGNTPGRLGRFTARWLASVEHAHRNAGHFPGRYLVVRYEALATRTDATMRHICDFLAEPVDDAEFTFELRPLASEATSLRRPDPKYDPNERFDVSEADEAVRFLAVHAAGPLGALGYEPSRSSPSASYLARWPANRLALAMSREPTLAPQPARRGG